jgi:hypothetical protein
MKTKIISFCVLLLTAAQTYGQVKATRSPGAFTGIKAGGVLDIKIQQGDSNTVSLEAQDQESLDHIQTDVHDGILEIRIHGKVKHEGKLTILVTAQHLKSIETDGSASVKSQNTFKTDELVLDCSGASDVHMDVDVQKVNVKLSGAGDVVLKGKTGNLEAEVSGAGTLKATKLETSTTHVRISGAGDARINPKDKLQAEVSGAGDVVYQTEPREKTIEISGAGDVRQANSPDKYQGEGSGDTTKISVFHKNICITHDLGDEHEHDDCTPSNFRHWRGVDLGVNGLLTNTNATTMPKGDEFMELDYSKSISVGLNLFEKHIHIYHNFINVVTGLGFEFDHYALKNNVSLVKQSFYTSATNDTVSYKKNKLNENFITVPLMLEFNTSSNSSKAFHLAFGVLGEYRLWSKTKQDFTNTMGKDIYVTKSDDYNLDAFRCSLIGRVGYGKLTLYGTYGLTQLFTAGKGPQLYPFTVGINIPI